MDERGLIGWELFIDFIRNSNITKRKKLIGRKPLLTRWINWEFNSFGFIFFFSFFSSSSSPFIVLFYTFYTGNRNKPTINVCMYV